MGIWRCGGEVLSRGISCSETSLTRRLEVTSDRSGRLRVADRPRAANHPAHFVAAELTSNLQSCRAHSIPDSTTRSTALTPTVAGEQTGYCYSARWPRCRRRAHVHGRQLLPPSIFDSCRRGSGRHSTKQTTPVRSRRQREEYAGFATRPL